jgi:hypothetical protein
MAKYDKVSNKLFTVFTEFGNPKQAIQWSHKRIRECECAGLTDARSAPATKVHLLVEELAKYLPPELRNRFLSVQAGVL